jgi:hypothetical protein
MIPFSVLGNSNEEATSPAFIGRHIFGQQLIFDRVKEVGG